MKSKKLTLAAAVAMLLVGGCATTTHDRIVSGKATLIPGTVEVEPEGRNLAISALVDGPGGRKSVKVFATDCHAKRGTIFPDGYGEGGVVDNNMLNGPTAGDKLFTELCQQGMPQAYRLVEGARQVSEAEARRRAALTPEQRAAEDRVTQENNRVMTEILLIQSQNRSRERAASEIGNAIRWSR